LSSGSKPLNAHRYMCGRGVAVRQLLPVARRAAAWYPLHVPTVDLHQTRLFRTGDRGTVSGPEKPSGRHIGAGMPANSPAGSQPLQLETRGTKLHSQSQIPLIHVKDEIVAALMPTELRPLAESLADCGERLRIFECVNCGKTRTAHHHCDLHFCPRCQRKLAARRADSIRWWAGKVRRPLHVVLTARNQQDITRGYIRDLKAKLARLRRWKLCRSWAGGLWSLEVTNEGRGWHIHFHLLVDAAYTDARQLAIAWGKLVSQDFAVVKVKRVEGHEYVREVTKYTVKGNDLAKWKAKDIVAYVRATHGERMFGTWGNLRSRNAEWKRWVQQSRPEPEACECGCVTWIMWDEADWEWEQLRREAGLPGGRYRPPPQFARAV